MSLENAILRPGSKHKFAEGQRRGSSHAFLKLGDSEKHGVDLMD